MERQKYKNSPIKEALIDIRVDPLLISSSKEIESLKNKLGERYTALKPQYSFETKISVKDGIPATEIHEDKGIIGYQFWSNDEKEVVQFRLDGFTFSRLAPYDNWEIHFPEAFRAWEVYLKELSPIKVKRLAVRYVNVIQIPGQTIELEEYFSNPPTIPKGLPQDMEEFLSRISVRFDKETRALITINSQKQSNPDKLPFLLDIDVISDIYIDPGANGIKDRFEKIHRIADSIFESNLTDKCKELFN